MHRPALTLAFAGMLVISGCAMTQSGQDQPEPVYDDDYPETGSTSVTEIARTACRDEIVRRWNISRDRVRTTSRSTNWEGESLVNWEISNGGAGYCRVDAKGNVSELKVESDQNDSIGDFDDDDFDRNPDDDFNSREVRSSQIQACRDEVVRRFDARTSGPARASWMTARWPISSGTSKTGGPAPVWSTATIPSSGSGPARSDRRKDPVADEVGDRGHLLAGTRAESLPGGRGHDDELQRRHHVDVLAAVPPGERHIAPADPTDPPEVAVVQRSQTREPGAGG